MNKYIRILSELEQKITDGVYSPGQKLPSVRRAAEQYSCSISTVIRAYTELEKRHCIYSIPQSGYYVIGGQAHEGKRTEGLIDFTAASPDINVFPYLDFQHCLNKAIDTYKHHLFSYGESQGLKRLRETLVDHLAEGQVFAKPEQIVITSGVQQALEILAKMPFPNGKSVILVEQPSYDIYMRFLEREEIPVYGVTRTASGIDLRELEHIFKNENIKFFYTMTRYQNPLGTSYSIGERKAIAKMADKYNVYIVEDDYMADLGEERSFDPVFSYNTNGYVIYLKSFSKIIFPGLRLGAAVLPQRLMGSFQAYKSYNTSLLSQAALEVYIKNGMYERHKRKISGQYAARIRLLQQAGFRYNQAGLIEIPEVQAGVYTQFKLPHTVNVERLVKRLAKRNIIVESGKRFYLSHYLDQEKFLRVSIARVKLEQIEEGVKAIVEETERGSHW